MVVITAAECYVVCVHLCVLSRKELVTVECDVEFSQVRYDDFRDDFYPFLFYF